MRCCSENGCGSHAINLRHFNRDERREDLCDVHYWMWRHNELSTALQSRATEKDNRFIELLEAYWNAAWQQGKESRSHDDMQGSAQIAESNLCHYVDSLRTALSTAREEGRREGIEEAWAKIDKVYRDLGYAPNYSHLADLRALQAKEGER